MNSGDVRGDSDPEPTAALWALLAEQGIDGAYPEAATAEVKQWLADSGIDDPTLDDRTALPFVTVDGPKTRDLDQALVVQRKGSGFVVQYAIADAAYFVPADSALFAESLRRGASYYLPGEAVPMLPRALSEGLISLGPDGPRRAMIFEMTLDADGECIDTQIVRARIRSRHQLTFDHVESLVTGGSDHPVRDADVAQSLHCMRAVGQLRTQRAAARGVVPYHRSEVRVHLAPGRDAKLTAVEVARNRVEADNAQLSLLCNAAGARFLRDRAGPGSDTQPIYKVHPPPDDDSLLELQQRIGATVLAHGLPDHFAWDRDTTSLAEYVHALPYDGEHERLVSALGRQTIMVNVRSAFAREPAPHHGVGADVYARFSAPMREVVGVFLHKELSEALAGRGRAADRDEALRQQVIEAANRAKSLQSKLGRAADQGVIDAVFTADLDQPAAARPAHVGTVMGLRRGRAYVRLDVPPLDVKVYLDRTGRSYNSDEAGATLFRGDHRVCRLGDAVGVKVVDRDKGGRWILDFAD